MESNSDFDLAIVGGGIYGCALYWEACQRGLKTVLIEQNDFGCGTSSNSLRTIHGGLRYLQTLDVARCIMSAKERQVLLGIAPNLIKPLTCVMPTQRKLTRSKAFLKAGTLTYDLLTLAIRWRARAGHKVPRTKLVSLDALRTKFPSIDFGSATGGALWHDAQVVDSERLTLAYVLSGDATGLGCSLNHTQVEQVLVSDNEVKGVQVTSDKDSLLRDVKANLIVDCSGSWNFLSTLQPKSEDFGYIKGFNLVFRGQHIAAALGTEVECEGNRSRLIFMSPWQGQTIVGTWYVPAKSGDDTELSDEDLTLALAELNSISTNDFFDRSNLCDVQVGQMPAGREQTSVEDLAEALQAHTSTIHPSDSGAPGGLYRLQGTKYTTAREGAKRMIDAIAETSAVSCAKSQSHFTQLLGCRIEDIGSFKVTQHDKFDAIYGAEVVEFCIEAYGERAGLVMQINAEASPISDSAIASSQLYQKLVIRAFEQEKAHTIDDVLYRRLGGFPLSALTENRDEILNTLSAMSNTDIADVTIEFEKLVTSNTLY